MSTILWTGIRNKVKSSISIAGTNGLEEVPLSPILSMEWPTWKPSGKSLIKKVVYSTQREPESLISPEELPAMMENSPGSTVQ